MTTPTSIPTAPLATPAEPTASPAFRIILALVAALVVLAVQPAHGAGGALVFMGSFLPPLAAAVIVHRYATSLLTFVAIFFPAILFALGVVGLLVR